MSRKFNVGQLPTGSYSISGSFSGSFVGDGSGIQGITATAEPAGPIDSVQFNDGLNVSGSSKFTFNKVTGVATVTSSFAITASHALNSGGSSTDTGSLLTTASVSLNTITFTKGDSTTFPITIDTGSGGASIPEGTVSGSAQISELGFVTSSATSSFVLNSQTSSMSVLSSSYAVTASFALNAGGGGSVDTGSLLTTASVSLNTITFTKGDGSTFPITVDTGSGGGGGGVPSGTVSSSAQITELGFVTSSATASFVLNSQTSSMSVATASYVETAQTASYVLQAVSASFAVSASYAPSADAFPFVGDAVITGSLTISGSFIPSGPAGEPTNVIIGSGSAASVAASAFNNVVIGHQAGNVLVGADYNVLIGDNAGASLTNASQNVIIGRRAGKSLHSTNAQFNVIIGADAGQSAGGSGHARNVIIGHTAGYETDGQQNVYLGNQAARGVGGADADYGVAVGSYALYSIRDGNQNTTLGANSLFTVRDGSDNIGLGYYAGYNIQDGSGNIIIGSGSLGEAAMSNQLRIGHADTIVISASLDTGDIIFNSTASADYFVGNGSELTNLTLPAGILSSSAQIATDISGAFNADSASFSTRVTANETSITSLNSVTGSYAITGSNTFTGNQTINGNLTVYGTGSFDVIHTIYETSSIIYASGSTKFGDTMDDTHVRTGSMFITGSVTALDYTGIFNGALSSSAQIATEISGAFATDSASFSTRITTNETDIATLTAATSSYILASQTSSMSVATASYIETAQTASYVVTAQTASYVISSSIDGITNYVRNDQTSSMTVLSSSFAITASHALNAGGGTPTFIASGSTSASAAPDTGVVVEHSGSTAFSVIGDVGTLFSVDDDLNGMLFTANDISGFPVLQASASGEVYVGKTPQSLYTTAVISSTTAATTHSLCTLSTSSYDGAFFEYTAQSGSNARAGNIMSTWNGSNIVYAETTTADIGRTSDLTTEVIISGSTARLVAYGANAGYKIKTIIKAI